MPHVDIFEYSGQRYGNFDTHFYKGQDEVGTDGVLRLDPGYRAKSNFKEFLPEWNPKQKYEALKFHKYEDPALRADPSFPHLFPKSGSEASFKKITPKLGTEIRGIQLDQLDDAGKDELALLVAQRGVVVFREQNFAKHGPQFAVDYGKHFGKLHIHQTSGAPKNHPELHVTFRRPDVKEFNRVFRENVSSIAFHTDVSYELQPPSYTFFSVLEGPSGGGDTLFADSLTAYERLSPTFQEFLSKLASRCSQLKRASQQLTGSRRNSKTCTSHPRSPSRALPPGA